MRRGSFAAGVAAAAGALAVARHKRAAERVEILFEDGRALALDTPSAARETLLAPARDALRAVRT